MSDELHASTFHNAPTSLVEGAVAPPRSLYQAVSAWMGGSGLPGKVLAAGATVGAMIMVFPLIQPGYISTLGLLVLLAYIGAASGAWFIYAGTEAQRHSWMITALGCAAIVGLVGIVSFIQALRFTMTFQILLNTLAALTTVVGAIMAMKDKREY